MKCTLLLLITSLVAGGLRAAEPTTPAPATGPIDVTVMVSKGIDFIRSQAITNEDGWFFHPIEGSKIVGWKTNIVHYKIMEVNIPGYRVEDPYEVMVPGNTPNDPMVKQIRYRTVVADPSKDHKEKREVYDPNGPIERNNPIAIYEKDEGVRWRYGGLGNNAMAIYALRRCGMPADDPLLVKPATTLARMINEFGLPDSTYDLAWLTLGFSVLPGDGYKQITERCAAKLMDVQITTGPATGLWSPVAINTQMSAALLKMLGKLAEDKKAMQKQLTEEQAKKLKGKPTAKATRIEEDMEKLDQRLTELSDNTTKITQLGMLMFDVFGHYQYGMDAWGRRTLTYQGNRLAIETLPYLIQNQISADLDSTALALFAMRVAFENGRLPNKSWRPETPKVAPTPGVPPGPPVSDFPPARDVRDVIAMASKALLAARPADKQWTELNIHQRVMDYTWLKFIPQFGTNEPLKLPQPVTLASVARGTAAIANLQMLQTGKPAATPTENEVFRPLVQDLVADKLVLTNVDVRLPFDTMFQMSAVRLKNGKPVRNDYTTWNQIAEWLAARQAANGSWGRTNVNTWVMIPSTSLLAMRIILKDIKDVDLPKMYDRPHITPALVFPGNVFRYGAPEASYFTVASLIFLADGLPDGWIPIPPPPAPAPVIEMPAAAEPAAPAAP